MFGISSFEFLVILLVALVALGPEKMPGLIRRVTRLAAEFRRLKTDFHRTVNVELANLELNEQHKKAAAAAAPPAPPEGTPAKLNEAPPAPAPDGEPAQPPAEPAACPLEKKHE